MKRAMPLTRRRRTSVRVLATALTLAALATACSDGAVLRSDDPADDVTTTAPTDRPSQSAAPTSTTSTTTTSTTTTSTLPRQRTTPIDPPLDDADEPVIELGTLLIPAIDVEATVYEGIRMRTLDRGPGHWPGSAMPGEIGNVVVGGHRTTHHRVFRHLDRLVPGDEIVFRDPDGTEHVYVVDRTEIVTPDAMWVVNPTDTPTATLFACHPPGSTRERIIVFADLLH